MAIQNLITPGEKFNFLTVLGECESPTRDGHRWATFRCECGNVKDIDFSRVRRGAAKSCGCLALAPRIAHNRANIAPGTKFGDVTYLRDTSPSKSGRRRAIFQCECEAEFESSVGMVKSGKVASCGCRKIRALVARSTTHGHSSRGKVTDIYNIYLCMRGRCENPSHTSYQDYGGRGITVCERWRSSFENFLADMGERPEGKTLDRYPNVDGNYEPGNCRWATNKEQALNRRSNVWLEHEGLRLTISQWAERLNLNAYTLYKRFKRGWPAERILSK